MMKQSQHKNKHHINQFKCPDAGTLWLQNNQAENTFILFIALSSLLTTTANSTNIIKIQIFFLLNYIFASIQIKNKV